MESASGRRKEQAARQEVVAAPATERGAVPLWTEAPLLLALFLAPFLAGGLSPLIPTGQMMGTQDPLPCLLLCCLPWLGLLLRALGPGAPLSRPRAGWLLLLFPLLAAASFFGSANPGGTIIQTLFYASYAVLAWLTADVVERGGAGRVFAALLAGALVSAGIGFQEYLRELRRGNSSWRAFGWFTNPNFFAGFLVPALLLTLGQGFRVPAGFKTGTWSLVLGLLALTITAALMSTSSRGAMLSAGVGLLLFLLLAGVRHARTPPAERDGAALLRVGGLLLVTAAVAVLFSGPLRQRSAAAVLQDPLPVELCAAQANSSAEDSAQFRKLTWRGTANMGKARPLLGWGAGSFDTVYARFEQASFTKHAHNSYLQLFGEEGVLAPLLILALLGMATWGMFRAPLTEGWSWAPGVAGALAGAAVHNVFDSLLFVPAIAVFVFALVGVGLARAQRTEEPARQPGRSRWLLGGAAAAGLVLTGLHVLGRSLLETGRSQISATTAEQALETLRSAQALLPWDYQVAGQQSRAARYLGINRLQEAVDAGQRMIRLTPERAPSYYNVGALREAQGDKLNAMHTYRIGLEHAPHEVQLLYALARVQDELNQHREAVQTYQKIVDVEQSPLQQVRALAEFRDWRYPRARVALAREAEARGRPEEALAHRKAAACFLAERHRLEDAGPQSYFAVGDWDPDTERSLRDEETQLWTGLAQEYRKRGENRLAELCAQQASITTNSRTRLETIIEELQGGR